MVAPIQDNLQRCYHLALLNAYPFLIRWDVDLEMLYSIAVHELHVGSRDLLRNQSSGED